jgi:predicted dehydrogenase
MLRGAFVGFGNVAEKGHAPGWRARRSDVEIVAATDAAPSRREAFLAAFPGGRWHDTPASLLSGERLDFVDICAPPGAHAQLILQALDARLHVLSEKPLVTRVADAEAVAAAAACSGRIVQTVHNWLKAPVCLQISALMANAPVSACGRGGPGRRRELASRSSTRRRGHSVRPRLACSLLRDAMGRRSACRLGAPGDPPPP